MKRQMSKTQEGQRILTNLERRLRFANRSGQTILNYVRGLRTLINFHNREPRELDIDQVIDLFYFAHI